MDDKMSKEQLREVMAGEIETLLDEVMEAMNTARPGSIIDDSEEAVRDASGKFRRMLFEKALELRSQSEAFSPSAEPGRSSGSLEE